MAEIARALAGWAVTLEPTHEDLQLADRSLRDTVAVTLAARGEEIVALTAPLPEAARWAAIGHVLDFDDLHMASTTHISVVCVPAVLAAGGDARAYLAAAGVMARLGTALGWEHYTSGWHATCTAGAPAAAAGAAVARGLDADGVARAMALAVPAAGGVQRAFGTAGKSLQVGFAADAGARAARLAAAGASADPSAVDQWFELLGGDPACLDLSGPAVPGGLAIKIHPCCYALQRPIAAIRDITDVSPEDVSRISITTPRGTVQPLIHHRPETGLQGKFSLEYALAAALLDGHPGFDAFTDAGVRRPAARALVERVHLTTEPGGDGLLAGAAAVRVELRDGSTRSTRLALPPGSPGRPPDPAELAAKLTDCVAGLAPEVSELTWNDAPDLLRAQLPSEWI